MLLLIISSFVFFPLEIQPKSSNDFAVELFIVGQPHWQVGQCWNLPDTGGTVLCFPGNCHPAGGEPPQRDGYETNTLFGSAWTFWQAVWVTETLFMCLWAPQPAELPFPWQWFPFQVTSAHKVWCNIIENVHVFIRGYSIKYAGTFKYISDCDSKQSDWIYVRGLWWTLKCLHLTGSILFL